MSKLSTTFEGACVDNISTLAKIRGYLFFLDQWDFFDATIIEHCSNTRKYMPRYLLQCHIQLFVTTQP